MKKLFAVILLTVSLLSLLSGCGTQEAETTSAPTGSGLTRAEVLTAFEKEIHESEISDYYTMTRLPEVELPGSGDFYQALVITDIQSGYTYHVGLYSTAAGDVYSASISFQDEGLAALAFPNFCLHLVNSLKLLEVDGFGLSEDLDLFGNPSGSVTTAGWVLTASSAAGHCIFYATYTGE